MIRAACAAALVTALSGVHQPVSAQVIPPSVLPGFGPGARRVMVAGDQPPWRGVVRVQTEVGQRCSGALVGLRLVLTAAHCLFGHETGKLVRPSSIHVLVGYNRGGYVGHARTTGLVIGLGYALGLDQQRQLTAPADADWAVLTLDAPLNTPDRLRMIKLATRVEVLKRKVRLHLPLSTPNQLAFACALAHPPRMLI